MALWNEKEPEYFRFNEALLLPFERAMQLETCDPAVQDQVLLVRFFAQCKFIFPASPVLNTPA